MNRNGQPFQVLLVRLLVGREGHFFDDPLLNCAVARWITDSLISASTVKRVERFILRQMGTKTHAPRSTYAINNMFQYSVVRLGRSRVSGLTSGLERNQAS